MGLGSLIYSIFIGPLELFFEVVFAVAARHVSNPAFAIIMLSLAMNFLVLPLYRRADAVQAEERDRENAIAPWVRHIKKTFKGDERFMMLQAYYREVGYKPTDTLKGSISLLLEIPFFIAAYHFLSHLETIRGISFGPIADLGAPDALLNIGSVTLNFLPILMTLINVVSAAIYMKGFPIKSKVQMYGIALIFLILLYNSPAGLVFYWTLNNIFSLIKNLFYKIKNPELILKILCSAAGIILLLIVIFVHPMPSRRGQAIVILGLLCMQIPIIPKRKGINLDKINAKDAETVFYAACALLTILTGILIPSSVIGDSTEEFISITNYFSPYWLIISSVVIAFGTLFIWFGIFYRLASKDGRIIFSFIMVVMATAATIDYMFFGKTYGNFSSTLIYDVNPVVDPKDILINIAVLMAAAAVLFVIFWKKLPIIKVLSVAMCMALAIMSGLNVAQIHTNLAEAAPIVKAAKESEPEISLSSKGQNVVVIMMDRQVGRFIPYLMHEKPELKKKFDGFTYYSNSFSYGPLTNFGSPGLYGGYEYIPEEMNARSDMKLADKQNEALKVMPKLFSESGFNVTVFDPTYAGYTWIPDLTIYNDMPEVKKSITMGRFPLEEYSYEPADETANELRKRNFFLYSMFKVSPVLFQKTIYAKGTYNEADSGESVAQQEILSLTESKGMKPTFLSSYAVLSHLPAISKISNSKSNTFFMMSNDLTHEPMMLQEPSFEPSMHVDNSKVGEHYMHKEDDQGHKMDFINGNQIIHYESNMAAMLKLGDWMDFLREKGVYDNTRIIIVSDHGRDLRDKNVPQIPFEREDHSEGINDTGVFNCVLLVKDFNARGIKTDDRFISNAETPALATEGLIPHPKNPYTGKKIATLSDQKGLPKLIYSSDWSTDENNGNTFMPAYWFTVRNNIFDGNNWEYLGYH